MSVIKGMFDILARGPKHLQSERERGFIILILVQSNSIIGTRVRRSAEQHNIANGVTLSRVMAHARSWEKDKKSQIKVGGSRSMYIK
jgi:hypothetical protein